MPVADRAVIGGVDIHADVHVPAVVDHLGGMLGTASSQPLAPDTGGWFPGCVLTGRSIGGTGSYGAALARSLRSEQVMVV